MDCAYHPGIQATGYCTQCGRPACQTCLASRDGRTLCALCAAASPAPTPAAAPPKSQAGVALGIGCCSAVLLIGLAIGGYFGYRAYTKAKPFRSAPVASTEIVQKAADAPTESSAVAEPTEPAQPDQPAPTQPGQEAADAAAMEVHPSWYGQCTYRSPDWTRVKVQMGATKGKYTHELVLQWDASRKGYRIERDAPIPAATAPSRSPSEAAAKATALGSKTGWKAKVVFHTADWQRVKVYIGPANGAYTTEVVVQWDGKTSAYRVERTGAIPKPEPTARPSQAGAIAAARSTGRYAWVKVQQRSSDWTWAILIASQDGDFEDTAIEVRWNGRGYTVVGTEWISGAGDAAAWEAEHGGEEEGWEEMPPQHEGAEWEPEEEEVPVEEGEG